MLKNTFFGYAKPKKCIYGILMSYIYPIPPTFFVKYKGKIRKNKKIQFFLRKCFMRIQKLVKYIVWLGQTYTQV